MTANSNPKALNIEEIDFNGNKLTVGFKCLPEKKYYLAKEAEALGITLSQHIENLLMNLDSQQQLFDEQIKDLEDRISFYENDILRAFYDSHKLKQLKYVNGQGQTVEIMINDIKDIYTVLINSFKEDK